MNLSNVRGLRAAFLFAATAALGASAMAQAPIYRCGDSYSQTPCAGGKIIAASDSRSADQKAQTDEATKRNAKAASEMEKARVKDESKAPHAVLPAPPVAKTEDKPALKNQKAEKPFTAVSPKTGDDKKKKNSKKKKEKT
jgi:hypothetical protein